MIWEIPKGGGAALISGGGAARGLEKLVGPPRRFGCVIVYGHFGAMDATTPLPLGACLLRGLNLQPSFKIFAFTGNPKLGIRPNPAAIEHAKTFVAAGLASGLLKPAIDRVFTGLDEYAAAHRYMSTNTQAGKIVLALR